MSYNQFPNPTPIFPTNLPVGWSVQRTPTWEEDVALHVSGRETRTPRRVFPVWDFLLLYEVLRDQTQNENLYTANSPYIELQTISQLFLACMGKFGEFYYSDPDDNSRFAAPQLILGNGTKTAWRILRPWGASPFISFEPIGGINFDLPVHVYLDGVLQLSSTYTVANTVNGSFVTFNSAPAVGKSVTMDFTYYYRCQWMDDMQDYEEFYKNLWGYKSCHFRTVKP